MSEKSLKFRNAQEAKRILGEPLLKNFFSTQEAEHLEAFKRLPMGTTLETYQTVHHDMLAVDRLRLTIERYIQDYKIIVAQESLEPTEGI